MASAKQKASQAKLKKAVKLAKQIQEKGGHKTKTVTKKVYNIPWKTALSRAWKQV